MVVKRSNDSGQTGLVHLDLKPESVLLHARCEVVKRWWSNGQRMAGRWSNDSGQMGLVHLGLKPESALLHAR